MQSSEHPVKPRAMRVCLFLVRLLLLSVGSLVLLIGVAWTVGALWFDFPVAALRRPLAAVFGLSAIAALVFVRPHWQAAARRSRSNCAPGRAVAHDPPFQYARLLQLEFLRRFRETFELIKFKLFPFRKT